LRFHPGDVLIEIGERGSFACIILEGKFSVTRKGAKQSFVVSEGELLGEIALFAASKEAGVRSAQVVAETEGTVACTII
jgi:CRP-like cAMP-binding protein